ncbi:MAG: aldehyde dehydrogenase [Clostridia bacterium]|nr:aldehyde dehydrogenase [Clostridia bacterium]
MTNNIDLILESQKKYFRSGATLSVESRVELLQKLYDTIKEKKQEIAIALAQDLGKSEFESFMCETGMVLSEITYMIKNTAKLAAKQKAATPLAQFPSTSYRMAVPYGNVLVMSPWNYPFLLALDPVVDAVAAGNTVVLKPSAYSPATTEIVRTVIEAVFPAEHVAVVTGGRKENQDLLTKKFDMVFFTGSQKVGKEVLRHTAEHLTPTVLELGGKCPCIVDKTANISLAAKRIVFGKFLNCGQTCVAPDYILCDKTIKYELIGAIQKQLRLQYGVLPIENPSYGKMINEKHYERVAKLIDPDKVAFGGYGKRDQLQIAPTLMDHVTWDDPIMQEEIFGPVLPVLDYEEFEDIFGILADKPKPLALYLFTEDKTHIDAVNERLSYGGGCINDTVIHLATTEMGFGGVGESGMGSYHGKAGFEAFSHIKSIVEKKTWLDLPMRYQPTKFVYEKLLEKFLK